MSFKADDKVTIRGGYRVYGVSQTADYPPMAKVWPVDQRDKRNGFWISVLQLNPFTFEMTKPMADILRSATAMTGFIDSYVGSEGAHMIGAGLVRVDADDDWFILEAGRERLAAWDALHGSSGA